MNKKVKYIPLDKSLEFDEGLLPIKQKEWNPRFLAYCDHYNVNAKDVYNMTPSDIYQKVGNSFGGYIQTKWDQFFKEEKKSERMPYEGMHLEFNNWLCKNK